MNKIIIWSSFAENTEITSLTDQNDRDDKTVNFDDLLKNLGEFGTYQKFIYCLICLPAILCGIYAIIPVFLLGVPEHRYVMCH